MENLEIVQMAPSHAYVSVRRRLQLPDDQTPTLLVIGCGCYRLKLITLAPVSGTSDLRSQENFLIRVE